MAIRIRRIDGILVALCAAKTEPEIDDLYLDDGVHHALSVKFDLDLESMGFLKDKSVYRDSDEAKVTRKAETK